MIIESNIAEYLHKNQIQQKRLAQKIGMREDTLSLTLTGKRKMLAEEYVRICDALCVPIDKFIGLVIGDTPNDVFAASNAPSVPLEQDAS